MSIYFLINDDAPLLITSGYKSHFPPSHQAVAKVLAAAQLRQVACSQFESAERTAFKQ